MTKLEEVKNLLTENGELNFNWKEFDILTIDYWYAQNHPEEEDGEQIQEVYEKVYAKVAEKCNETGEYGIFEVDGHFLVCTPAEYEQKQYELMSDEEKLAHDEAKRKSDIEKEISELKQYLANTDYIVVKINEVVATGTDEEVAQIKAQYSEQLTKRKEARQRINELEESL